MTGEEHFLDAERHLNYAADASHEREEQYHLARAQVHATLALAASQLHGTVTVQKTSVPTSVGNIEKVTEIVRTERRPVS